MTGLSLSIAIRYLRRGQHGFAGFITWVSVAGLAVGVWVLTVVVSVMNGFDGELKERLLQTIPHVLVAEPVSEEVLSEIAAFPGVQGAFRFFQGTAVISRNGVVNPVALFGLDQESAPAFAYLERTMARDSFATLFSQPRQIVLGRPLAAHLGLVPGDVVPVIVSSASQGQVSPAIMRFELAATFEVGSELDYSLALVNLAAEPTTTWQRLGELGVQLRLAEPLQAPAVARALSAQHPELQVTSWADRYGALFRAVQLEKAMMFVLLLLVVAVAAFNIVSGQMMVVNEKRSEIAILQTMGAEPARVRRVFLLQGALIATLGIAVGLALGVLTAQHIDAIAGLGEDLFGFNLLEGSYFVRIPSRMEVGDLVIIAGLSWGLCLLSAWWPASRAARSNPLAGLHLN